MPADSQKPIPIATRRIVSGDTILRVRWSLLPDGEGRMLVERAWRTIDPSGRYGGWEYATLATFCAQERDLELLQALATALSFRPGMDLVVAAIERLGAGPSGDASDRVDDGRATAAEGDGAVRAGTAGGDGPARGGEGTGRRRDGAEPARRRVRRKPGI